MAQFNRRAKSVPLFFIIIIIFIFRFNSTAAKIPPPFSAEKAGFSIKFKDEISPYQVMGVFVLPSEIVTLEIIDSDKNQSYQIQISSGVLNQINDKKWQWQAPSQKGLFPLTIIQDNSSESMKLNIFVMVPFKAVQGEYLNCYRIGEYPQKPLKNLPIYQPPQGFIEVTPENQETLISPHFKLNQFLCKQECDSAKYLILEERLILKLELFLEKVNEKGYACNTFHIMSGYRTPHYNEAIGNVKFSRHCWGGAADIFIDENPKDEMMDDLNNDGKIDLNDAKILYDIIDVIGGKPEYEMFIGGLGKYKKTASHGPFVHVDVRGYRARWGD